MLIDAGHPEETRVAVIRNNRLEEFDFETASKKQIKSNIYLAKVIRIEPSLQAAFVDYGGNRHGFLPFDEIHHDYYQISDEERLALQEAEKSYRNKINYTDSKNGNIAHADASDGLVLQSQTSETAISASLENGEAEAENNSLIDTDNIITAAVITPNDTNDIDEESNLSTTAEISENEIESDDDLRSQKNAAIALLRSDKIQNVIKRRQIILVQIVKEERSNKGASLTTYLSLAGRYCVLMPNNTMGGGISRKIQNSSDRKYLKEVTSDLEIPASMSIIVRTAGLNRSKQEIKRDCDYLLRLWDCIRDLTFKSAAPALIYEGASARHD